ncbi:MAG: hypothetical protein RLY50_906 [Actinomycetota bacterium]|jgi:hypothetical protein
MNHRPLRRLAVATAALAVVAGCSGSGAAPTEQTLAGIGRIPGAAAAAGVVTVDGVRAVMPPLEGPVLAERAGGNKLLVIGDSILAATASRYGGAMCDELVPRGWRVAVEAEAGQMVGFGRTVVRERITEGWDAAVVFLGTNYGGNEESYENDLDRIVVSLGPRPTLLLTATEYKASIAQVNRAIRRVAARNPHASVLDWGAVSLQAGVLNRDKVHPTAAGRTLLVESISAAAGDAPSGTGSCLPSVYVDDSLVTRDDFVPSARSNGNSEGIDVANDGASSVDTTSGPAVTQAPMTTVDVSVPATSLNSVPATDPAG